MIVVEAVLVGLAVTVTIIALCTIQLRYKRDDRLACGMRHRHVELVDGCCAACGVRWLWNEAAR